MENKNIDNIKGSEKKTRAMISFDWAIKNLLRNKANFGVLEGFLSELIDKDIKIKSIGESEGNKTDKDDKYNRVDILVEVDNKELVIIELQFDNQHDYFHRMLYGASKAITEHIHEGDNYDKVRKVYSINIVYFDLGKGKDYIYRGTNRFIGINTGDELELSEEQKQIYNRLSIMEIFPEYFLLMVRNFEKVGKKKIDQWMYYLKTNKIQDDFDAQGLDQARQVLAYENMSEAEKKDYLRNIENRRIKESELQTALYKGKNEGFAEGVIEGIEKGEKIGIEKEKLEIAKKMKNSGMLFEQIREFTNLTKEEIENL